MPVIIVIIEHPYHLNLFFNALRRFNPNVDIVKMVDLGDIIRYISVYTLGV